MIQLILHLIGDYVTQSDWMANNKTKCSKAAAFHAVVYSLPFLLLGPSWTALAVILVSHFLIDRFRLARWVVVAKNALLDPIYLRHWFKKEIRLSEAVHLGRLSTCWDSPTGYPSDVPPWLAVWLLIAADNTLHLAINYAALAWL